MSAPSDQHTEAGSAVLAQILAAMPEGRVSAGWMVDHLRGRAFGVLLLVLAVLTLIPGIATLSAILLLPPAVQMISGRGTPALPGLIRRLRAPTRWFRGEGAHAVIARVRRLEQVVRPRFDVLARPPFSNLFGLLVLALALAALVPVPLFHVIPAAALIVIALGIVERDGWALLAGAVLGAAAVLAGFHVWGLVLRFVIGA